MGANHPIRVQTMTTTDTMDTIGTVEQSIRCIEAGAELVRITAPSKNEAENLRHIKDELRRRGYDTPLVAGTLAGRNAWTGDSVNYVTTEINLPASTTNQSIRLRWRFGSDDMEGGTGWWIDNVQITNAISGFNNNAITIPAPR